VRPRPPASGDDSGEGREGSESPGDRGRGGQILRGARELAGERPLTVTVRGGSMVPLLSDGDRVALAPSRWLLPGDVVAFRAGDGRLVVHRLLGYRWAGGIAIVTRGDASLDPDPPVARDRLLGKVVGPESILPTFAARRRALASYLRLAARALRRRVAGAPRRDA
jgi:hypothetical protein